MKKILACLCCVSLLFGTAVCNITASAGEAPKERSKEVTYKGITYYIDLGKNVSVTAVDDKLYASYNPEYAQTKVFAFPSEIQYEETGETLPVTYISGGFRDLSATKIIIPKTVKNFNAGFVNGFAGNESLEEVTIEEGSVLENIGSFYSCTNLKRIGIGETNKLPDTVTSIGGSALEDCSSLESIVLSDNLEKIKYNAFKNCIKLQEIDIPATISSIEPEAFYGCTNLAKVNFNTYTQGENKGKSNLNDLSTSVFKNCTNLTEINLPLSTHTYKISDNRFENTGIKSINIPESVDEIKPNAFVGVNFENTLETDRGEKYAIGIFNSQCQFSFWLGHHLFGDQYNDIPKDERPTIAGYAYSTSNDFAITEDFNFISVGEWNPFKVIYPGDVDGDGKTSSKDSMLIQRSSIGLVKLTDDQVTAADVNKDGKVSSKDALLILRFSIGYKVEGLS